IVARDQFEVDGTAELRLVIRRHAPVTAHRANGLAYQTDVGFEPLAASGRGAEWHLLNPRAGGQAVVWGNDGHRDPPGAATTVAPLYQPKRWHRGFVTGGCRNPAVPVACARHSTRDEEDP